MVSTHCSLLPILLSAVIVFVASSIIHMVLAVSPQRLPAASRRGKASSHSYERLV